MACILHYDSTKPSVDLAKVTCETLARLTKFTREWQELNKEPEKTLSLNLLSSDLGEDAVIRKNCYVRITSSYKLDQAKKSMEKVYNCMGREQSI